MLSHTANAQGIQAIFGTQRFAPQRNHLVTGPLVQLQTAEGATLSFQQGAKFRVEDNGSITLAAGNLRIGPVASTPIQLNLPQGPVTVAPNTALTLTTQGNQTTGRIYHGELTAHGQTFSNGQGFIVTQSGARGTFSPAAAQAPTIQPADTTPLPQTTFQIAQTTPHIQPPEVQPEQPTQPQPEDEQQPPEEPVTEEPVTQQPPEEPAPEEPSTEHPQIQPPVTPEPQPEPEPELPPVSVAIGNLIAAFSQSPNDMPMPDNVASTPANFRLNQFANGTHTLQQTEATIFGQPAIRLSIGTALQADTFSLGSTAGLGRWVDGELLYTANRKNTLIPNFTAMQNDDETTTILPHSLHYVWGEKATSAPTSGRVTYTLAAATQPTYTGELAGTAEGSFTGNLAIDFAPAANSVVGTYHFNGTVTMPQTNTGTTTQATYNVSTDTGGAPLSLRTFDNPATLNVTASAGASACPGGCTGTVNAAGFGNNMQTVGTLYAINPTGQTGITGAALFTANP